ncbi:hypothetical protein CUMW_246100 [Citrus unshiu]|uniref:Uncharacterized protein n=1 Tax=Citrus unshiu TaxID=55188 RepID=A0A2H5QNB3_CITUN|nr:hypothetical protein CUMW_246100 [Citrus unshiu]
MGGIISTFFSADTIRPILFYVGGQAKYIWGLKGNLDDLQTETENLIAKKLDLLNKVRLAEQTQPRAQRTSTVKLWFERVDRSVTLVEGLQQERDQEIDILCLGGLCSKDLISSYDFGKKVEKLKEEVIKLREKGEAMKEVYEGVPEGAAVAIAVDRTIVGQESILDQVWRCITDQKKNNGIIGLYGMGGIGKTTLLKQVNNKFCSKEHDFDVVIWSVVSREPNLKQIQEYIGKRIGSSTDSWQRKSFEERASDITNTLKHKKFVLLLDDIWESEIDLTKLGVPLQTLDSGSRIVFTTRFEGTCGKMGAHKNRLVSLHHLDMSSTKVRGLPQELKALVNLRYLNLEYTRGMSRIPQQLISSFSKLQVLRMLRCGRRYQPIVEEGNVLSADAESLMKEIHCLEQLNLITLSLHGSRGVENFLKFPKLQNITQALSIEDCNSLPLNLLHLANMEHLEELYIEESNLEDWNVDCAGEVQKMRKLHFVTIYECSNVKDLTWLVFVPNLKWLRIVGCDDMEEIISVENFEKLSEVSEMMGELNLFSELELLVIRNASNLERIYRDPLPFPQLNRISILKCPKLKKLPLNSSSAKGRKIVIAGQKEWWEELQWEDQATQNAFSPCFRPIEE